MPFWSTTSRFPRTNNNNQGNGPQKQNITNFVEKVKFARSNKTLQRYIGFLNYYRNYIPRLAELFTSFFQPLKTTGTKTKIPITPDIMKEFRELNEALDRCCQLALRQPLPGKQLLLMTNASFHADGFAWRRSEPEVQFNTQNLRSYSLWLKNILPIPIQNVHVRKRIFSHLHGL